MTYFDDLRARVRRDLTKALQDRTYGEVSILRTLLGRLDNAAAGEVLQQAPGAEVAAHIPDEAETVALIRDEIAAREHVVDIYTSLEQHVAAQTASTEANILRRYLA